MAKPQYVAIFYFLDTTYSVSIEVYGLCSAQRRSMKLICIGMRYVLIRWFRSHQQQSDVSLGSMGCGTQQVLEAL